MSYYVIWNQVFAHLMVQMKFLPFHFKITFLLKNVVSTSAFQKFFQTPSTVFCPTRVDGDNVAFNRVRRA